MRNFRRLCFLFVGWLLALAPISAMALPTVGSTLTRASATTLVLTFSEAAGSAAATKTNYTLSGTSGFSGNPSAASLDISGTSVTLTVPTMASLIHGETVIVTVANTLAAGNLVATYTVDAVPSSFSFSSISNALPATAYESAPITVSDINTTLTASTTSGFNSTLKCATLKAGSTTWGAFGDCTSATVSNGDQLKLQLTTASTTSTAVSGGIVLAGVSATFSVTTYSAEASAPVPIPSNVSIATLTSLTTSLSAPPGSLYLSSNGVIVVPSGFSGTLSVLPSATANTAFSIQSGVSAGFVVGGNSLTIQASGSESALLVLKTFKVDNYTSLQTLELAKGRIVVTQSTGAAPIISVQLGTASTAAQVAVMHAGSSVTTIEALVNGDTTANISVISGSVGLRKASAASTVALTDLPTQVYRNEVAKLSTAGAISAIRVGSLDGNGTGVGDPMTFSTNSILLSDITRSGKIPRLSETLPRLNSTATLLEVLFDTIGLRSNLARGGQNSQGVVPLLINGINHSFVPFGDVTIDTTRSNGVMLTTNGVFEIVASGVVAKFRPSLFDTQGFATSLSTSLGATAKLNTAGVIEVSVSGNTLLMVPDMLTQSVSSSTSSVAYDSAGMMVFTNNRQSQQLLPVFFDISQLATVFASFANRISIQDNLNGTVTAHLFDTVDNVESETATYVLAPSYEVLSPIIVQNTHLNDAWWVGNDGLIYIKYSNGAAQGFSIR